MAISLVWSGIIPNGYKTASDISTTSGQPTISSASNPWLSTDVGLMLFGDTIPSPNTRILAYTDAGHITMAVNSQGTGSNRTMTWWNGGFSTSGINTDSLTCYAVVSGTNTYLLVKVYYNITDANWNMAATANGRSMTLVHKYFQTGGRGSAMFGLIAPDDGLNTIVVYDTTTTARQFAILPEVYTGVHQTTPTGTAAHAGQGGGGGTNVTLTVNAAVGDYVTDVLACNYKTTTWTVTGSGQTLQSRLHPNTWNFGPTGGQILGSNIAGAASVQFAYTASQTEYWSISGVPLKPAEAASPAVRLIYRAKNTA